MRRSWALLSFGSLLLVLAVATVSPRSQAAGVWQPLDAVGELPPLPTHELELLPRLAAHGALFGSFARPNSEAQRLEGTDACRPGMLEVEGDFCPQVEQVCLRWLDSEHKFQCAEFAKNSAPVGCPVKAEHKHFCMDRYEWPNTAGALPAYMASWYEAKSSCESIGKRLCTDTEWTLACEGPERQPYPYGDGYERDALACNVDKPYIWPHPEKVFDPKTRDEELARLDQREPSGSRTSCVSPYGVYDMVGNVDEWVVNASQGGHPYVSGLKGGYWGPVRTRCRPMTTGHSETFRYYQIGFRCCGDPLAVDIGQAPLAAR